MGTLFKFLQKINHDKKAFFVWDCDSKKIVEKLKEENNTIPFIFERNMSNKIATKGIENLFEKDLFQGFITTKINSDNKTTEYFEENKKNDFMKNILKNANEDIFKNFQPLMKAIKKELPIIN